VIAGIVVVLVPIGLVMVLSASSITSFHRGLAPWGYFQRQALWAAIGAVALVIAARTPYHSWRRYARPALYVTFVTMLLPFVPSLGTSVNGARAWVSLGAVSFQPSEFMKPVLLVVCADLLARRAKYMHDPRATLFPCLGYLIVACGLVVAQGDLGSGIVLAVMVLTVLFLAGTPLTPLAATSGALAAGAGLFVLSSAYRRRRWTAFLDLAGNREHSGYQVWQSLVGIADGGLTGTGIGAGSAKWGYLPLAHSDFIFTIIAEELGFVGVTAVVGSFALLAFFGTQAALAAPDRLGMLLAGGITAWITVQAIINIGGVTGMLPVTGLTLPLLSFGGSSLLTTMASLGLLLSVARAGR
jgi:cell division protein FtsW